MHLLYVRIICTVTLFIISGIFFLLPLFIKKLLINKKKLFETITNILNCLSSGIFFGVITLDLWPAALEQFREEAIERKIESKFPYAELCTGVGFFLIYMIEKFHEYPSNLHFSEKKNLLQLFFLVKIFLSIKKMIKKRGVIMDTKKMSNQ